MLSRRAFLSGGAIAFFTVGASGPGPNFLSRAAAAATTNGRRKVLVTLFQRGAMDGVAAVTPLDEERWLKKLRPRLALEASRNAESPLLDLGVNYGLHPALEPLLPLWGDRHLAIVHAVGSPDPTRSHFDAQDYMETGTPGVKSTRSGWLNRVCGELGHEPTPMRAMALTRSLPRSLYGEQPALAVANLADLEVGLPGMRSSSATVGDGFESLYRQTSQELLRGTAADGFDAVELVERLRREGYRPRAGVRYPRSPLGGSLRQIALLIKAEVGLEVAFAETGGWDTHVQQGAEQGSFARRARDFADSIGAFWQDLGNYRDDVVLLSMTEFGRTVAENGSGGTDHGHGSCLFVLGGEVDGGKVHGTLESLDPDALYQGRDLPVTTDFRAVFSEVAAQHLGVSDSTELFPGYDGKQMPLWRQA